MAHKMYGFLYDQGNVGQEFSAAIATVQPIAVPRTFERVTATRLSPEPPRPTFEAATVAPQPIAPAVALTLCAKPAGVSWMDWLDRNFPGWVFWDYNDPNTILGRARCPGSSPDSPLVAQQRFPRDRTNRYFVAFKQFAAGQIACQCCRQECLRPSPMRVAPGTCPARYTKVTLSAHLPGGGTQELCSVCVPLPFIYATGGDAARICASLPNIYPGSIAPTT